MAHRGSISSPLEPYPEMTVRSVASAASILNEREGPEAAGAFVMVQTGMSLDEVLNLQDAILEREARRKKFGLGGLR